MLASAWSGRRSACGRRGAVGGLQWCGVMVMMASVGGRGGRLRGRRGRLGLAGGKDLLDAGVGLLHRGGDLVVAAALLSELGEQRALAGGRGAVQAGLGAVLVGGGDEAADEAG